MRSEGPVVNSLEGLNNQALPAAGHMALHPGQALPAAGHTALEPWAGDCGRSLPRVSQ